MSFIHCILTNVYTHHCHRSSLTIEVDGWFLLFLLWFLFWIRNVILYYVCINKIYIKTLEIGSKDIITYSIICFTMGDFTKKEMKKNNWNKYITNTYGLYIRHIYTYPKQPQNSNQITRNSVLLSFIWTVCIQHGEVHRLVWSNRHIDVNINICLRNHIIM